MEAYKVGDIVKIRLIGSVGPETPWAIVKEVLDKSYKVELNNHPVNPEFKIGELYEIPEYFILRKYEETK